MKYFIQETPYHTCRVWITSDSFPIILYKWLDKNCCWNGVDKIGDYYFSWEFDISFIDILPHVLTSHGIEKEEDAKNAEWLK